MVQVCSEVTYVLKLEQNKWYVGKTSCLNKRLNDHFSGNGSQFTRKYHPVSVVQIVAGNQEKRLVAHGKKKYGVSNVRGAGHTYE